MVCEWLWHAADEKSLARDGQKMNSFVDALDVQNDVQNVYTDTNPTEEMAID